MRMISIIIPDYNKRMFIAQSLRSLQQQAYQNWEALVVDDASTDSSVCIVSSFIENDGRIFFVGNTIIDTLLKQQSRFQQPKCWQELGLTDQGYFVLTQHRPANVDQEGALSKMLQTIIDNAQDKKIVFPVHPRTAKSLAALGLDAANLHFVEPLPYLEFNYLVSKAFAVITDSGGITEEATLMGVPCMTLRDNTERPETITMGTNELVGTDPSRLKPYLDRLFRG